MTEEILTFNCHSTFESFNPTDVFAPYFLGESEHDRIAQLLLASLSLQKYLFTLILKFNEVHVTLHLIN